MPCIPCSRAVYLRDPDVFTARDGLKYAYSNLTTTLSGLKVKPVNLTGSPVLLAADEEGRVWFGPYNDDCDLSAIEADARFIVEEV
jgi:hypothetical protein